MFLLFVKMLDEQDIRILVTRKTRPALKKSCWLLMLDLLAKTQITHTKNLADMVIRIGSNEMYFTSLDDAEKLKSFERINYIWAEEASELSKDDYLQLNLRCRGENLNGENQLYFSFNPVDEQSFWKELTENPPANTAVNHSTYKDNAFLKPEYVEQLEGLIEQDETYYKIYTLGLWATPTEIIYTNWDVVKEMVESFDERIWGLDFGYSVNPAALVEIRIKGDELWEMEHLYETGLTNPDLIARLKEIVENKTDMIIADSAEPKTIEEISRAGLNIIPCVKGADSVRFGINSVKSFGCHIQDESVNLLKEKRSYKWRKNKNNEVLDEPVKIHDHLMDAERYAVSKVAKRAKVSIVTITGQTDENEDDMWTER